MTLWPSFRRQSNSNQLMESIISIVVWCMQGWWTLRMPLRILLKESSTSRVAKLILRRFSIEEIAIDRSKSMENQFQTYRKLAKLSKMMPLPKIIWVWVTLKTNNMIWHWKDSRKLLNWTETKQLISTTRP